MGFEAGRAAGAEFTLHEIVVIEFGGIFREIETVEGLVLTSFGTGTGGAFRAPAGSVAHFGAARRASVPVGVFG